MKVWLIYIDENGKEKVVKEEQERIAIRFCSNVMSGFHPGVVIKNIFLVDCAQKTFTELETLVAGPPLSGESLQFKEKASE
ncbi:hypothetical protein E2L07_05810 [Halalkalibacterium halodurans]|uniref:hypothetical protein n=1 Tax=Halalkalibacterium halodurans TaxID=86665 RepID=UPI00106851D9|nr:hypothetical protein [Halalkalibacterium halodurans]TES56199.1 hypothetical protein E2L07_05810 [Halalkalibacterium halodurans]